MAENLLWLSNEYYHDRKIICWGATMHFIRNVPKINTGKENKSYDSTTTMGQVVWDTLEEQIYVIATTAYTGKTSSFWWNTPFDIGESMEGSIEYLINAAGFEFAFLDLRNNDEGNDWSKQKLICRPLGNSEMEANWTEIMDGIFFIKEMTPSTKMTQK